jgi:hypothetical protein
MIISGFLIPWTYLLFAYIIEFTGKPQLGFCSGEGDYLMVASTAIRALIFFCAGS